MSSSGHSPYCENPFHKSEKKPPSSASLVAWLEAQFRNSTLKQRRPALFAGHRVLDGSGQHERGARAAFALHACAEAPGLEDRTQIDAVGQRAAPASRRADSRTATDRHGRFLCHAGRTRPFALSAAMAQSSNTKLSSMQRTVTVLAQRYLLLQAHQALPSHHIDTLPTRPYT